MWAYHKVVSRVIILKVVMGYYLITIYDVLWAYTRQCKFHIIYGVSWLQMHPAIFVQVLANVVNFTSVDFNSLISLRDLLLQIVSLGNSSFYNLIGKVQVYTVYRYKYSQVLIK